MEYLKSNVPNVTGGFYSKMKSEIQDFQFTEKDGLLASDRFVFFKNKVEEFADKSGKGSFANTDSISPLEHERFEAKIRKWLKEHPVSEYNGKSSEREIAFNNFIKTTYEEIKGIALEDANSTGQYGDGKVTVDNEGKSTTPIITVDPKDIPK